MKTAPTFVCPMHPGEISNKPGQCSKCDMQLVFVDELSAKQQTNTDRSTNWHDYMPLIVVGILLTISTGITSSISPEEFGITFLRHFMAGFFLVFAGFKLLDLSGFAQGYSTYDLLAQKWYGYGYMYPFIELIFGFLMLAGFHPDWLLWSEFIIMMFSGVGVAIKLAKKEQFTCACLGTILKVPLTSVTLVEDFGMAALALALILLP